MAVLHAQGPTQRLQARGKPIEGVRGLLGPLRGRLLTLSLFRFHALPVWSLGGVSVHVRMALPHLVLQPLHHALGVERSPLLRQHDLERHVEKKIPELPL